jgi:hypothetical protein
MSECNGEVAWWFVWVRNPRGPVPEKWSEDYAENAFKPDGKGKGWDCLQRTPLPESLWGASLNELAEMYPLKEFEESDEET